MLGLKLKVEVEKLPLSAPFRISGFVFEEQDVVVVNIPVSTGHDERYELR